ncbi:hypothetical protein V2S66_15295 [Streptomyces sp. V4-01]|uniref:Uncharacterized protein n=1 Tax=Actinacidiphila polyblastidii TaxID=3110430 RepID=A0ABU7PBY8_9ACTN|nr:hypothetical protein [Streptomyces sp. V4-01]
MIEDPRTLEWFVQGVHRTGSPYTPGESHVVVALAAVKEMIGLVARGHVHEQELLDVLDACALRLWTDDDPDGAAAAYDCTDDCPVCQDARAEFDAIAAASYTHKVRLADPEQYPYAAEKSTLHRSGCPRVARFVGHAEPLGSTASLAALPAFAHDGVCTTAWAAGMQVMAADEAVVWARHQVEPPEGAGYKLCRYCLPAVPGTGTSDPWAYAVR